MWWSDVSFNVKSKWNVISWVNEYSCIPGRDDAYWDSWNHELSILLALPILHWHYTIAMIRLWDLWCLLINWIRAHLNFGKPLLHLMPALLLLSAAVLDWDCDQLILGSSYISDQLLRGSSVVFKFWEQWRLSSKKFYIKIQLLPEIECLSNLISFREFIIFHSWSLTLVCFCRSRLCWARRHPYWGVQLGMGCAALYKDAYAWIKIVRSISWFSYIKQARQDISTEYHFWLYHYMFVCGVSMWAITLKINKNNDLVFCDFWVQYGSMSFYVPFIN